jgi:hypothetical protein
MGEKGITTSELHSVTGLMDITKAVSQARKEWLNRGEYIQTTFENHAFLGFFKRKQARYFLKRN